MPAHAPITEAASTARAAVTGSRRAASKRSQGSSRAEQGLADVTVTAPMHGELLAVIEPADPRLREFRNLLSWYRSSLPQIEQQLVRHGAVLLRNFGLSRTEEFSALAHCHPEHRLKYFGGATPRARIGGNVYQSTRIPPAFRIGLHQEKSYMPEFPRCLAFFCKTASPVGGETLLCDMQAVTQRLPETLKTRFRDVGVRYLRNFRDGSRPDAQVERLFGEYHRVWQEAFDSEDRDGVSALCGELGLEHRWLDDGSLTVANVCPGLIRHPKTGEEIWFNQSTAQHVNPLSLGRSYNLLRRCYDSRPAMPYEVRYGNGEVMPFTDIEPVYQALAEFEVAVAWQPGDYLLVDNIRAAHGRNPYSGDRDIQVALID
jgi:alpha-ketoglutarate-dependent taurine dioxygenase